MNDEPQPVQEYVLPFECRRIDPCALSRLTGTVNKDKIGEHPHGKLLCVGASVDRVDGVYCGAVRFVGRERFLYYRYSELIEPIWKRIAVYRRSNFGYLLSRALEIPKDVLELVRVDSDS